MDRKKKKKTDEEILLELKQTFLEAKEVYEKKQKEMFLNLGQEVNDFLEKYHLNKKDFLYLLENFFLEKKEKTFEKSKQGEAYTDEPKEYI